MKQLLYLLTLVLTLIGTLPKSNADVPFMLEYGEGWCTSQSGYDWYWWHPSSYSMAFWKVKNGNVTSASLNSQLENDATYVLRLYFHNGWAPDWNNNYPSLEPGYLIAYYYGTYYRMPLGEPVPQGIYINNGTYQDREVAVDYVITLQWWDGAPHPRYNIYADYREVFNIYFPSYYSVYDVNLVMPNPASYE